MVFKNMRFPILLAVAFFLIPGLILFTWPSPSASAQVEEVLSNYVVMQKTKTSIPGMNDGHQIVVALPPREDGLVWRGDITWAASKPVEIAVLHGYNSSALSGKSLSQFGEPLKQKFGNVEVAMSLMKPESGTSYASGSISFVGNSLVFHTAGAVGGEPFTVTYTVAASAEKIT